MEFSELEKIRQSVRQYQQRPVARELLDKLIESVRLAPSARRLSGSGLKNRN